MPLTTNTEIASLGERFAATRLPKAEWTHEGHFAAALWLLSTRGRARTLADMPALIRAHNESVGTPNTDSEGYHETITLASIAGGSAVWAAEGERGLAPALRALMASRLGRPDWLLEHWVRGTLFSAPARRTWVPPDMAALPLSYGPLPPSPPR